MKPAPFEYQAPGTLREALDLLASNPEAAVIAGGQSLMPVLAFRLATPSLLVDLKRVPGLGDIAIGDDGIRLGAMVRWRDIQDHPGISAGIRCCGRPSPTSRITRSAAAARSAAAWPTPIRPPSCPAWR